VPYHCISQLARVVSFAYTNNIHVHSPTVQLSMVQAPANTQLTTDGQSAVTTKTSSKSASTAAALAVHDTSLLLPLPWGSDSAYSYAYDTRATASSSVSSDSERVMRGLNHLKVCSISICSRITIVISGDGCVYLYLLPNFAPMLAVCSVRCVL
jgi:hypothetical protein